MCAGGAGEYEVIRCGEAGHNIRNRPTMKGTPVGLLCRTSKIKASTHVNNSEGDWVQLERESVETYCEKEGEAWTLARSASEIVYLEQEVESEYETDSDSEEEDATSSGAAQASAPVPMAGLQPVAPFGHPAPSFPWFGAMPGQGKDQQQGQNVLVAQQQPLVGGLFRPVMGSPFGAPNPNAPVPPVPPLFGGAALPIGRPLFDALRPAVDNALAHGGGFAFGQPFGGNAPVPAFGGAFGGGLGGGVFGAAPPAVAGAPLFGGFGPPQPAKPSPFQFSVSPSKEDRSGEEEKRDKAEGGFSFGAVAASSLPAGEMAASPVFTLGASPQKSKLEEGMKKTSRSGRGGKMRSKSPAKFGGKMEKTGTASEDKGKVCKALSPAVAKSMRAVFAAFMWHEGITHDAMACASYLKFHPELTKTTGKEKEPEKKEQPEAPKPEAEKKEQEPAKKESEQEETEKKEETATDKPQAAEEVKEGDTSEKAQGDKKPKEDKEQVKPENKLPATLRHLVAFWDELVGGIQLATSKKLQQPKVPELKIRAKIVERPETEQPPKPKEKPKVKPVAGPGQTVCELCDEAFPNPVTYHMKRSHPGCGKHAAGQGYNSGGTFCGGWAGNCGDGGHGGSTWYLMCNSCHDKYIDQKKDQSLAQDKRMKHGGVVVKMASGKPKFKPPSSSDSHNIITENCRFLLELESASETKGDDLGRLKSPESTPLTEKLSWEETLEPEQLRNLDLTVSPSRKFQYLERGISVPSVADTLLIKSKAATLEEKRSFMARSPSIEERITMTLERGKIRARDASKAKEEPRRPSYLRSISVAVPEARGDLEGEELNRSIKRKHSPASTPIDDGRKLVVRGPVNLVERMSPKLYKLVQRQQTEAERDKQSSPSERALKRPLLSFVCQQLDLDCMRRSMVRALTHSACRIHAMEAFEWQLRHVTQTAALHDLMWFFAASLTPPPPPEPDAEEKKEGEKKEKEEVDLTMGEHPAEGLLAAGDGLIPLTSVFHTLLRTISDLMGQLPQGSAVQQMAMRSWCLHFQTQDHTFLHRSYVFSRINQMLTHVDDDDSRNNGSSQAPAAVSIVLLPDIAAMGNVTASSRPAMLESLTDGSTETFWESGDEDKHRSRWLQVVFEQPDVRPEVVYVHVDNNRDSGVSSHVGVWSCDVGSYAIGETHCWQSVVNDNGTS